MSLQGLQVLAVVPARGGSKGIPRKNLQPVAGLSLVGHAARVIAQLSWLDAALISTDDEEIAAEAERHGLPAPFRRPADLSGDRANSVDMWCHAWLAAEKLHARSFDVSILLEPTSPLRTPEDVTRTVLALIEGQRSAAATVSRTPAHFTPHKTLTLNEQGVIGFYLAEGARHSLRQSIPAYYHRNGICYAVRREALLQGKTIIEQDCAAVVIDRPVVNIDDELDLRVANLLANDAQPR